MSLYRTNAQSPFQNATGASRNAMQAMMYAAAMRRGQPSNTPSARLRRGLQGIIGAAREGQMLSELGTAEGWWFNDWKKNPETGRWENTNPQGGQGGLGAAQPAQGGTTRTGSGEIPVTVNYDPPTEGHKAGDSVPVEHQAKPGGKLTPYVNPQQTPSSNPAPTGATMPQGQGGSDDNFLTRMWNTPGGRGALIGAGLGLFGAALDYF